MSWKFVENIAAMNVVNLLKKVLSEKETQDFIINLNTEVQLHDLGIDSTGVTLSSIGGGYSQFTLNNDRTKKKDTVTLFDTGAYYKSFKVKPLSNGDFDILSNDTIHGESLFDRWGDDIEGLVPIHHLKVMQFLDKRILQILCK